MSDTANSELSQDFIPKIMVFGVGGAGVNIVNDMILSQLDYVKFVVANTDCQNLGKSLAETKIQLGIKCTKGLGAGSDPNVGRQAAEEAMDTIKKELSNTDMLFIATGMGGGTGTGASPIVAKIARDMGVLTIAVAIKPFAYEGKARMDAANKGVNELEKLVDTLMVIENEKVASMNNVSLAENYTIVNSIVKHAVYCVVDILVKNGFINRDFADVKTVLSSCGRAVIGYGEDIDPTIATNSAIHNPILSNNSINGATKILVNITGNRNLKASDMNAIVSTIAKEAKTEPNIIHGITFDDTLGENIRVAIIAAGVKMNEEEQKDIKNEDCKPNHTNENSNQNEQQSKIKQTSNPVFAKKINEDDLIGDCDGISFIEEIPYNISDNIIFDKNSKIDNEKKKMNNNDLEQKTESKTIGLFEDTTPAKSKSIFGKLADMIVQSPDVIKDTNIENIFNDEKKNNEDDVIYNIPAYKRVKRAK